MKLDLGAWIVGLGALVVAAAVIAGFFAIPDPGEARALRLDAARLESMQRIATAAQCAYTFTGRVPSSTSEIRQDFLERRVAVSVGVCGAAQFTEAEAESVSYAADGAEHIILCADFHRPTPPEPGALQPRYYSPVAEFPEFREPRAAPGRHCYRVRLVRQVVPSSPAAAAERAP
jgi:hypothetical protein